AVALVNLYAQTHIPQAEQALASSRIGYQTGKVDFLALVDSLRVVEQVHLEHIAAATDFEKAYADLEQAVGQELPRQEARKCRTVGVCGFSCSLLGLGFWCLSHPGG